MSADGSHGNVFRRALDRLTGRADTRDRIAGLERAVRKLAEAQRDHAATLQAKVRELAERVAEQPTMKDVGELGDAVQALGGRIDRSIEHHLAHGTKAEQQQLEERRLARRLEQIASRSGPVLVGPWTGEVGFELLYWIPFLEWARTQSPIDPRRLVIVSRGGVHSWYGVPGARYADALSLVGPEAFRNATGGDERKQRRVGPFDREVVEAATAHLRLTDVDLLHPGLMYRMLMPFWKDEAGFTRLEQFTRYRRLEPPVDALPAGLPSEYVAVRFYFSQCFPDTPANREFVRSVVAGLAARGPVVLLNPGLQVDDHTDCPPGASAHVHTIADGLAPERNLAVQSAVIAGARAFVGTYGGYSYLAPFYGVPALAFFSDRTFKVHHLQVAQRVFERLGTATVMPIDTAHAPLVQLALGAVSES